MRARESFHRGRPTQQSDSKACAAFHRQEAAWRTNSKWKGDQGGKPLRIRLDGQPLYCIWLDRQSYWGAVDERDDNAPANPPARTAGPKPGPFRPRG